METQIKILYLVFIYFVSKAMNYSFDNVTIPYKSVIELTLVKFNIL